MLYSILANVNAHTQTHAIVMQLYGKHCVAHNEYVLCCERVFIETSELRMYNVYICIPIDCK